MKKPILVVMAAGMGSRYGGLKQMDPVGSHGEVIMDYSLYDARRAGFEKLFSSSNIPLKMHLKKQSVITFPNIWKLLMHIRIWMICRKAIPYRKAVRNHGEPAMQFLQQEISLMHHLL